jgi:hypothetical protein
MPIRLLLKHDHAFTPFRTIQICLNDLPATLWQAQGADGGTAFLNRKGTTAVAGAPYGRRHNVYGLQ